VQALAQRDESGETVSDLAFHGWYKFVLGFSPGLVRHCLRKFETKKGQLVLDPFCGTGTTNVECKRLAIDSIGIEANPVAYFAAKVKTQWNISSRELVETAEQISQEAFANYRKFGLSEELPLSSSARPVRTEYGKSLGTTPSLNEDERSILPRGFINERPLTKVLILRELVARITDRHIRDALSLALATTLVNDASNLGFGPEVHKSKDRADANVIAGFLSRVERMANDLREKPSIVGSARIILGDSRAVADYVPQKGKVNFVITSPPYPNEKDYTRMTRLESVVLELIRSRDELRSVKNTLIRSNSRNVFVSDRDDQLIKGMTEIEELATRIEKRRIALRKTSGFEKLYHRIVLLYFGGMCRHLQSLKPLLSPNARLAYVVGDQMSFFRINIETARLLGQVARRVGYRVEGIHLWRTRLATATKMNIPENILYLKNE